MSSRPAFTANAGIGRTGAPKDGWVAGTEKAEQNYVELFNDAAKIEAEWYRRTGIYPFHGLDRRQGFGSRRAPVGRQVAAQRLRRGPAALSQASESGREGFGQGRSLPRDGQVVGDPLPQGIKNNRAPIEALIKYVHQQGMLKRSYAVSEFSWTPKRLEPLHPFISRLHSSHS